MPRGKVQLAFRKVRKKPRAVLRFGPKLSQYKRADEAAVAGTR